MQQTGPTDRPSSTLHAAPRRARSRLPLAIGAAAVVAVLALVGVGRALDLVPGVGNPFAERVVEHDRPALELALSDLSEYHAAQGRYQVTVDLEKDTPWVPGIVKGERTTYLATGTVDGLVDFRDLGKDAVRVDGDAVTIVLPPPRLGEPVVDLDESRVVARDRGLVDRITGAFSDSPTSEREVAQLAEQDLARAAAESDLERRAQDNTRKVLTGLARSFGFPSVTVRFEDDPGV